MNFRYSTNREIQTPIWPNFSSDSEFAKLLIKTKQDNDDHYWDNMRLVFDNDCNNLPMERFKVWVSVWNVPLMSMSRHSPYIKAALNASPVVQDLLQDPLIGCNEDDMNKYLRVFTDNNLTMNRMQHYGHLKQFNFNPKSYANIVELGAGIGDMADVVYKLGFEGRYNIFDFPEVSRIQKWYHDQIGHTNITYTHDVNELDVADLCIATWSLTEMPFDLRDQLLDRIGKTKSWLIAYSENIFGYDNEKWIHEVFLGKHFGPKNKISFVDVPWMPWDGGTKYLFIE